MMLLAVWQAVSRPFSCETLKHRYVKKCKYLTDPRAHAVTVMTLHNVTSFHTLNTKYDLLLLSAKRV